MKIPSAPPNTPYYHGTPMNGMEVNPLWQQANGVIVEGAPPTNNGSYMIPQPVLHHGVPPQPPHHPQSAAVNSGYMAQQQPSGGVYYPPSETDSATPPHNQDFSEYMWMHNQEEFDKEVMQQLEEEALMQQCIEAMLADEREAMGRNSDVSLEEQVSRSTLNPLAAEFVPSFVPAASVSGSGDAAPVVTPYAVLNTEVSQDSITDTVKELSLSEPPIAPEEVSAKTSVEEVPQTPAENEIVVVSAKSVLTPKSSIDDSLPPSKERRDSDKRKTDNKKKASPENKKEKVAVAAAVTAAIATAKTATPKAGMPHARTHSGGDKNKVSDHKKSSPNNNRRPSDTAPAVKKQEEKVEDVVDLQGPPLPAVSVPVVSALSSTPASEPEKPATPPAPVVFNYAAAAKANLPPKVTPTPQSTPPPKESINSTAATAVKSQTSTTTNKSDTTPKTKSSKPGDTKTESKKPTSKGSSASKKGGKK